MVNNSVSYIKNFSNNDCSKTLENSLTRCAVNAINNEKHGTITRSIMVVAMPVFALMDAIGEAGKALFNTVLLSPKDASHNLMRCGESLKLFITTLVVIPWAIQNPQVYYHFEQQAQQQAQQTQVQQQQAQQTQVQQQQVQQQQVQQQQVQQQQVQQQQVQQQQLQQLKLKEKKAAAPMPMRVTLPKEVKTETISQWIVPPKHLEFDNGEVMLPKAIMEMFFPLVTRLYVEFHADRNGFAIGYGKGLDSVYGEEYVPISELIKSLNGSWHAKVSRELDCQAIDISQYAIEIKFTIEEIKNCLCRSSGSETNNGDLISLIEDSLKNADSNAKKSAALKAEFDSFATSGKKIIKDLKSFLLKMRETLKEQKDVPDWERQLNADRIQKRLELLDNIEIEHQNWVLFQQVPVYNEKFWNRVARNLRNFHKAASAKSDVTELRFDGLEKSMDDASKAWEKLHDNAEEFRC